MSRAHHLQLVAWRSLREEWTFEHAQPLPNDTRFVIPEVASVLHDHEILLDAGALLKHTLALLRRGTEPV